MLHFFTLAMVTFGGLLQVESGFTVCKMYIPDIVLQELPIYEPGLDEIVKAARGRNLFFSTDTKKHVAEGDIIFVRYRTHHPCSARPAISLPSPCCNTVISTAPAALL